MLKEGLQIRWRMGGDHNLHSPRLVVDKIIHLQSVRRNLEQELNPAQTVRYMKEKEWHYRKKKVSDLILDDPVMEDKVNPALRDMVQSLFE